MNLLTYLLEPRVFWAVLLALVLFSLGLVWLLIAQDKKMRDLEKEAALNREMYHGLKSQYQELEQSSEQLLKEQEQEGAKQGV